MKVLEILESELGKRFVPGSGWAKLTSNDIKIITEQEFTRQYSLITLNQFKEEILLECGMLFKQQGLEKNMMKEFNEVTDEVRKGYEDIKSHLRRVMEIKHLKEIPKEIINNYLILENSLNIVNEIRYKYIVNRRMNEYFLNDSEERNKFLKNLKVIQYYCKSGDIDSFINNQLPNYLTEIKRFNLHLDMITFINFYYQYYLGGLSKIFSEQKDTKQIFNLIHSNTLEEDSDMSFIDAYQYMVDLYRLAIFDRLSLDSIINYYALEREYNVVYYHHVIKECDSITNQNLIDIFQKLEGFNCYIYRNEVFKKLVASSIYELDENLLEEIEVLKRLKSEVTRDLCKYFVNEDIDEVLNQIKELISHKVKEFTTEHVESFILKKDTSTKYLNNLEILMTKQHKLGRNVDKISQVNNRIKEIIDVYIDSHPNIRDEFVIGRESIYKYISFYFWVTKLQEREEKKSIRQIFNQLLEEEVKLEMEDDERDRFYERMIDVYPNLNYRINIEKEVKKLYKDIVNSEFKGDLTEVALESIKQLKTVDDKKAHLYLINMISKIKSKRSRNIAEDKAILLTQSQQFAYKLNLRINEDELLIEEKKTHKRIRNSGSKLSNIKYIKLQELFNYYKEEIEKSNHISKELDYYQLEKCLNFSLITEILYQIKKYSLNDEAVKIVSKDMVYVALLPFIDQRKRYVDAYFEWGESDRESWRREVNGLYNCTLELIKIVLNDSLLYELVEELEENRMNYSIVRDYYLPNNYLVSYPKHQIGVKNLPHLLDAFDQHNQKFNQDIKHQIEKLRSIYPKK